MLVVMLTAPARVPATERQYPPSERSFDIGNGYYSEIIEGGSGTVVMESAPYLSCVGLPGYQDDYVLEKSVIDLETLNTGIPARAVREFVSGRYEAAVVALSEVSRQGSPAAEFVLGCVMEGLSRATFSGPKSMRYAPNAQREDVERAIARSREVMPDPRPAWKWISAAAEAGFKPAQWELARRWSEYRFYYSKFIAVDWLRRLAAEGAPRASTLLAHLYESGRFVPKDEGEAYRLAAVAAAAHDPLAMRLLASFYANGIFVDPDKTAAVQWLTAAADDGDVEAQLMVGRAFAEGYGVNASATAASTWYRKAAEAGSAEAAYAIATVLSTGTGIPRDLKGSEKYMAQALRAGECNARLNKFEAENASLRASWPVSRTDAAIDSLRNCEPKTHAIHDDPFDTRGTSSADTEFKKRIGSLTPIHVRTEKNTDDFLKELTSSDPLISNAALDSLSKIARSVTERLPNEKDRDFDPRALIALAVLAFPSHALPQSTLDRIRSADWRLQLPKLTSDDRSELTRDVLASAYTEIDLTALFQLTHEDPDGAGEVSLLAELGLMPAVFDAMLARLDRGEPGDSMHMALIEYTFACSSDSLFAHWITPMRGYDRGCGADPPHELLTVQQLERLEKYNVGGPLPLALAFLEGRGAEPNSERALTLLLRPDAGILEKALTARILEDGRGVAADPVRAAAIYQQLDPIISAPELSNEAGAAAIATRFGILLFEGWGVSQDSSRAIGLLKLGVCFKAPLAEMAFGDALFLGLGVGKDEKEALRWYRQAAADEPMTLVRFGFLAATNRWHERGLEARRWYDLAAASKAPTVSLELARALTYGPSLRKPEVLRLLQLAAASKNGWALAWLAACPRASPRCLKLQPGFPRTFFTRLSTVKPLDNEVSRKFKSASAVSILDRDVEHLHRRIRTMQERELGFLAIRPIYGEIERIQTYHGDADGAIGTRLQILLAEEQPLESQSNSFAQYRSAIESSCRWGLASQMAQGLDRKEAALLFAKIAVNRLQNARAFLSGLDAEVRECFVELHKDRYRWLAQLLINADRLGEAENVLGLLKDFEQTTYTRSHSRDLATVQRVAFSEAESDFTAQLGEVVAERWRKLRNGLPSGAIGTLIVGDVDEKFQDGIDALVRRLSEQESEHRRRAVSIDRVQRLQSINRAVVTDLKERLPSGSAAAYALVLDDRVHWILATAKGRQHLSIPVRQAELEKAIVAYRSAIVAISPNIQDRAKDLYHLLFESMDRELSRQGIKTVMLSLDRRLRYLPFAALYDGSRWLVEKYAFSSFSQQGDYLRPKKGLPWRAAAFAVTHVAPGLPALEAARQEVDEIVGDGRAQGAILEGERHIDEEFTKASLLTVLDRDFRVIHIASHFMLDPVNGENSFLELGDGTKLPLLEIRKNSRFTFIHTDLVTLSACQTALAGHYGDGSEIDSLGTIAEEAGAPAVLASLWSVDDVSTARLMINFYRRRVAGDMSLAQALQGAQLHLLHNDEKSETQGTGDFAHPYYWAPFILIGNWQ